MLAIETNGSKATKLSFNGFRRYVHDEMLQLTAPGIGKY